ncbi:MAG TPA: aldehyde dehydrogenase family protein, partial [Fimbriimonadaceae bacterium]|nr:aldehyde dehydrogenase family protein [Fimbriimonadaceae bacterium]
MIPVGADWEKPSLGATTRLGSGPWLAQLSPIDGSTVQRVRTMTLDEIAMATNSLRPLSAGGFEGAQARLMAALGPLEPELRESLQLETAYVTADCQELTLALLDFARDFKPLITASSGPTGSYGWPGGARSFELQRAPWGVIAMVLPRNAFALLAVTCILNALAAGNSVIVRAPTQCARTAGLLADVLQEAGLDRHV